MNEEAAMTKLRFCTSKTLKRYLLLDLSECVFKCIDGVKSHVGVSHRQTEVKLLRNALWTPNLVGRTRDQNVTHCWGERSCKSHMGSTRGLITYKAN